ncbi:MAG TPA: hypothetical protein VM010_08795, partial [Chitinophagaceae bacterium]|nr:hypothetical protein [Chitinophagaceae bacterium]
KTVYNGFPWYSTGVNGFVGVADVAEAIVQLLQSDLHQKRFIVSAENRSFRDVFAKIAEGLHAKPPHIKATPFLGEVAWRAASAKAFFTRTKPMLTRESARNAHTKTLFDNGALLQALPSFSFTPLDVVIEQACVHYLQAIKNGTL